jgi:uncharacterized membrane protein
MIKQFTSLLLFLLPITVTYAIVSDLGKPQHHYHSPSSIDVSDSVVSRAYAK